MDETREEVESKEKVFLSGRQRDYMLTFDSETGKKVLADLKKFCRDRESTFSVDPRAHALLEGRREVLLRIQHHLEMPLDELVETYTKGN